MNIRMSDEYRKELLNRLTTNNCFFQENGDTYVKYDKITVELGNDTIHVDFYFNNQLIASYPIEPFNANMTLTLINLRGGLKISVNAL